MFALSSFSVTFIERTPQKQQSLQINSKLNILYKKLFGSAGRLFYLHVIFIISHHRNKLVSFQMDFGKTIMPKQLRLSF